MESDKETQWGQAAVRPSVLPDPGKVTVRALGFAQLESESSPTRPQCRFVLSHPEFNAAMTDLIRVALWKSLSCLIRVAYSKREYPSPCRVI